MAATSFGDVPLPSNNRIAGDPLDVERMAQAVMQDKRRPRDATTRIRRPTFTNESGLCDDRLAFIRVEIISEERTAPGRLTSFHGYSQSIGLSDITGQKAGDHCRQHFVALARINLRITDTQYF